MSTIGASAAQRGLLYALAGQCGEAHPHIKDRAARQFGLESITELTSAQAAHLIRTYQDILTPPEPIKPTRANFLGLPKRCAKPAAPYKPAKTVPPRSAPTTDNELDQIPW